MRREGGGWSPTPEPSVDELRANAKGDSEPWTEAVRDILAETEDLTILYAVGARKRSEANEEGIMRWSDAAVAPAAVGISGAKMALDASQARESI
jgi:hypothetical protein